MQSCRRRFDLRRSEPGCARWNQRGLGVCTVACAAGAGVTIAMTTITLGRPIVGQGCRCEGIDGNLPTLPWAATQTVLDGRARARDVGSGVSRARSLIQPQSPRLTDYSTATPMLRYSGWSPPHRRGQAGPGDSRPGRRSASGLIAVVRWCRPSALVSWSPGSKPRPGTDCQGSRWSRSAG